VPNWIPVLERIVKDHSNDTVYIFGHSKVGERVTGSSKDLMDLRNYFTALVDYAKKQIAARQIAGRDRQGNDGHSRLRALRGNARSTRSSGSRTDQGKG
jgi:hypothetical protein